MTDLLDSSQIRQIGVTIFSAILAFATPTEGFVLALVIAFGSECKVTSEERRVKNSVVFERKI